MASEEVNRPKIGHRLATSSPPQLGKGFAGRENGKTAECAHAIGPVSSLRDGVDLPISWTLGQGF